VVATAVGGIPEGVRHGVEGLLVKPGCADDLADAIAKVAIDSNLRARMAESAARRGEDFDARRVVRHYEDCYHALVSR
jgi:glycogen synthase